MSDILRTICQDKLAHIKDCKFYAPEQQLRAQLQDQTPPRGFKHALAQKVESQQVGLIAEVKKASPSKGLIREDFHPEAIAKAYEQGGAACLSVLTDIPYFQGDNAYLRQARSAVSLPVLRKDFMLDTYQVTEARVIGADAILLIMAALEDNQAQELEHAAIELSMDVLIEIHNEEELTRAVTSLTSRLIGINNRNLKTMVTDLNITKQLAPHLPENTLLVAESGIATYQDIQTLQQSGTHCFLVGESLMRKENVADATRELLGQ